MVSMWISGRDQIDRNQAYVGKHVAVPGLVFRSTEHCPAPAPEPPDA